MAPLVKSPGCSSDNCGPSPSTHVVAHPLWVGISGQTPRHQRQCKRGHSTSGWKQDSPARPLSPSSLHSRLYSATRRGWEAAESTEYLWPSAGCEGQSPVVAAISPGLSVPGSK